MPPLFGAFERSESCGVATALQATAVPNLLSHRPMNMRGIPRMRECLRLLRERGIRLALASSSNPDEVEYYTQLLGVGELLSGTTSKKDAKFSKPSPEIFEAARKRTKTSRERTLIFGDTPYDILAAHRGAMAIAAVRCGGFERSLLNNAEFLFADVEELVEKIDRVDEYFEE